PDSSSIYFWTDAPPVAGRSSCSSLRRPPRLSPRHSQDPTPVAILCEALQEFQWHGESCTLSGPVPRRRLHHSHNDTLIRSFLHHLRSPQIRPQRVHTTQLEHLCSVCCDSFRE